MRKLTLTIVFLLAFIMMEFAVAKLYQSTQKDSSSSNKVELKPIQITDQQTQQELQTAYNSIVMANKDFQIAILKAKVKYKVPEDWEFNGSTLTFNPPIPKPDISKPKP